MVSLSRGWRLGLGLFLAGLIPSLCAAADPPPAHSYKAGVARKAITPEAGMWMAGYAARTKPAEGKVHDLAIKAIALEDATGRKLVLLTSDLIGIPRELAVEVADAVRKQTGLPREQLMLTASHTHCGPVLRKNLADMYDMPAEQHKLISAYTDKLRGWMIDTVVAALKDLQPARLAHGQGVARFAMNRRKPTPQGFINAANPDGPVDHAVPVLRIETPEGKLRAVVFGYACHNTTLSFYQWCGDYAGFAQQTFEEKHPGTVALFWMGCGGDANPLPRGKVEQAQDYGKQLARAVDEVLHGKTKPIRGAFTARYEEIALPFAEIPGKEKWTADMLSKTFAVRKRAERMLKTLENGAKIDDHYRHYPVQVWQLGDQVLWVSLGGEVVVDYSLRLKKSLAGARTVWVTAYANDVMAYIPSARVLKEGGYEGESSMIYYGMPTKWAPALEEKIVATVHQLAGVKR